MVELFNKVLHTTDWMKKKVVGVYNKIKKKTWFELTTEQFFRIEFSIELLFTLQRYENLDLKLLLEEVEEKFPSMTRDYTLYAFHVLEELNLITYVESTGVYELTITGEQYIQEYLLINTNQDFIEEYKAKKVDKFKYDLIAQKREVKELRKGCELLLLLYFQTSKSLTIDILMSEMIETEEYIKVLTDSLCKQGFIKQEQLGYYRLTSLGNKMLAM